MKDGLYRVVLPRVVAGFVIRDGCVIAVRADLARESSSLDADCEMGM